MPTPTRRLLLPTETAERVRGSEHTLANWRYMGIGPPWIKVGGRVRYDEEALNVWLEGRTSPGAA